VKRSLPLVATVLVIAVALANARVVIGRATWADVRYHTEVVPPRLAAAAAIGDGALPGWWDGTGLGVPLAAEPSHGALAPAMWLARTPWLLDLLLVAHLAWAALGVAVWARRRATAATGPSELAALVAGMLIATTGVLASAAVRGALPALAHVPWIGVAAVALRDGDATRERARAAIALAALIGVIALGGVLAVLADALVLALALAANQRTARWLAAAVAAGLAIGAAQWLPALYQLGAGAGGRVHALPLARLLELIVPGTLAAGDAPWAPSVFVGAPLLALAAVRPPSARTLVALGWCVALALVAGRPGSWPAWLGAPELHVAALALILAAHTGAGFDALLAGERRALRAFAAGTACAVVAVIAVAVHARVALDALLGAACMVAALALAWFVPRRWPAVIAALIVLPGVGALPAIAPVTARTDDPPPWAELAHQHASGPAPVRVFRPVYMTDHPGDPEELADALATFSGAAGARWDIASAWSVDPARARVHDRVWLAASSDGGILLHRFGLALAILPDSVVESVVAKHEATALGQRGRWVLAQFVAVAPPASVMRGWAWQLDDGQALALTYLPGGGTGIGTGTTVLHGRGDSQPDRGAPLACTIERWRPGDITTTCSSPVAGYAVISSSAARGWTATIDGAAAPWLASDVLRRAVAMPAGTHRIAWRYATPGLALGGGFAALGLFGLIALWITTRKR
jgi:hypothetical protein